MEAVVRKPYQGVFNIIRFNWHFYVIAGLFVITSFIIALLLESLMFWFCMAIATGVITSTFVSLLVSYYVYDRSDLYEFEWLREMNKGEIQNIVNIHAGFDETSLLLKKSFPTAGIQVFDFYDPVKHTEVSIERARKAYPSFKGTIKITTSKLPIPPNSTDLIFNIFALHEVRDRKERIEFLKQQVTGLGNDGRVVVVEHLRDFPNFFAYTIGFFHFFSEREWINSFLGAGLQPDRKFSITPFITVFILKKANGNTP
jgi:hypothetical protein